MTPIQRAVGSDPVAAVGKMAVGLIPYNSPTEINEGGRTFTEILRPGSFQLGRDIVATFNHNSHRLLDRTSSGTLRLQETPEGLRYEIDLPESAADVRELLTRGDLRGSSFIGFPTKNRETRTKTGLVIERLSIDLVELGPVTLPAYTSSQATIRSADIIPLTTSRNLAELRIQLEQRR